MDEVQRGPDFGGSGEKPRPQDEARREPRATSSFRATGDGAPPAVAALRMEGLCLWVVQRAEDFPRKYKFTIGDRWVDTCIDVQTSLIEASYVREKRGLLLAASRGLVRRRILARMATALRVLSLDQEAHFGRESAEIGRMIGGWLRSVDRRRSHYKDVPASAPV